jgi:hypothetical protein
MNCRICDRPLTDPVAWNMQDTFKRKADLSQVCRRASCITKAFTMRKLPTPLERRSRRLERAYGLTHIDYVVMLNEQDGGCAICHTPPQRGQHLAVDHDHKTGYVRGLLCTRCNLQLGWYEANRRAVTLYLRKHKIVPVR